MRLCRSKRSSITPTASSVVTEPQPQPQTQPSDAGSECDSAAESYAASKTSTEACSVCGYAGSDSRQHSSRGRRRRHHQCGASPVELLISGMTQTMRTLQAVSEQERMMREQGEADRSLQGRDSRDHGKDSELARETDAEGETGSDIEASDARALARGKYEQRLDKHSAGKDLPGYQTVVAGT